MLKNISKKIVAVIMCLSILFTALSIVSFAEIPFPSMAEIGNTKNGTTDIYSLPGTTGHEADKSTTSKKLDTLKDGTVIKIVGAGIDGDGDKWYEIKYGDGYQKKGFVYSARVKILGNYISDPEFEAWLTEQGFPESYKDGLRNMHSLYPKWKFYADHTNLDFNAAVKAQNGGVNNKYVYNTKDEDEKKADNSKKSYEKGAYNWNTGEWEVHDGAWVKTTDQVIAYYLDPRNFLDITNVFMFANEVFNAELEDLDFVKNAVKDTFMDAALPDNTEKTYAHAILEAAKQSDVSTAAIIAVIRQEQGTKGTGKLISGTYSSEKYPTELKGYYNFFNIGAYADSGNGYPSAADRGLWWARGMKSGATTYGRPWNTREKAIIGGALWYKENYVGVGQNTIYYKNFNVYKNTNHAVYTHQYATNIEDSVGKGSIMASVMDKLTDRELVFHIPVYKNMPEKTTLPQKGTNNNRFLKSLSVEGYSLSVTFDRYNYFYETIVPYKQDKVKINAVSEAADANISGAGEVELAVGNNEFNIIVEASSGLTATYKLFVYREKAPDGEAEMPEINTQYKVNSGYVSNIQPSTSISDFKTKLGVTKGKAVVMDSLGNEKKDVNSLGEENIISTGDFVHLYDANEKIRATYRVVIYGDINADGQVSTKDVYYLRRFILDMEQLSSVEEIAADINKDSKCSTKDVYIMRRHIVGLETIIQ